VGEGSNTAVRVIIQHVLAGDVEGLLSSYNGLK
jgi:hypothetical protein